MSKGPGQGRSGPRPCGGCDRRRPVGQSYRDPARPDVRLCRPCWKRLVWRPRGGDAVNHDRAVSAAYKDRHREEVRESNRQYKRDVDRRGRCRSCGDPMGIGRFEDGVCSGCRHDEARELAERIVGWWHEGLLVREIASRLGWTKGTVGSYLDRLRGQGYDLPYRYRLSEPRYTASATDARQEAT